jgi:hypothetical protein
VFSSRRFEFCSPTNPSKTTTEILKSLFGVTGRQRSKLENVNRTLTANSVATIKIKRGREFPHRLRSAVPLREYLWLGNHIRAGLAPSGIGESFNGIAR